MEDKYTFGKCNSCGKNTALKNGVCAKCCKKFCEGLDKLGDSNIFKDLFGDFFK